MADLTEKEKKQEEKEAKAMKKAEVKILDNDENNFCGFTSLSVLDEDGYTRVVKGSATGGPLFIEKTANGVVISASFTPNPLHYLEVQRDAKFFVVGDIWYGDAKKSPTNLIGKFVPKNMDQLTSQLENGDVCEVDVNLPFLKNSPSRLAKCKLTTKEVKFVTKVVKLELELSAADWAEWKQYRLRFWKVGKANGASGAPSGGDDDDEKKDKKDDDK